MARRAVLAGGSAAALWCTLPGVAQPATAIAWPNAASSRRFAVLNKGTRIGSHSIVHSSSTGAVQVRTEISLLVKVAFLTVFAFSHRSTEIWRGGRLVSLAGETVEHGATLRVDGAATAAGFRVVSKDGPFIAAAATLTSNSLWTSAVLEQAAWSTPSTVASSASARSGSPTSELVVAGRPSGAAATHSSRLICREPSGTTNEDLWVHGEFEHDGSRIQYELVT